MIEFCKKYLLNILSVIAFLFLVIFFDLMSNPTALSALVAAFVAIIIAFNNHFQNEIKLKHDLYEKRLAILLKIERYRTLPNEVMKIEKEIKLFKKESKKGLSENRKKQISDYEKEIIDMIGFLKQTEVLPSEIEMLFKNKKILDMAKEYSEILNDYIKDTSKNKEEVKNNKALELTKLIVKESKLYN